MMTTTLHAVIIIHCASESFRTALMVMVSRSTPMPPVAWVSSGRGSRRLHGLEDGGDALTSPDTHGDQGVPALDAPKFIQRFHRQDAARRRDGMAQRDATAVRVGAIGRQVQLAHDGQ